MRRPVLEDLSDRSHRPVSCQHQMAAAVEAAVLKMRRQHRALGPRRIVVELARRGAVPLPSESVVYRALTRAGLIEPGARRRRRASRKRWERGAPMEWQMDRSGHHAAHGPSRSWVEDLPEPVVPPQRIEPRQDLPRQGKCGENGNRLNRSISNGTVISRPSRPTASVSGSES